MEQNSAGLEASAATKGFRYARHRPEQTLLYQLVERYYRNISITPCIHVLVSGLRPTFPLSKSGR